MEESFNFVKMAEEIFGRTNKKTHNLNNKAMKSNTEDLEKDIVSFEHAKKLHSLGWDTPTLCGYEIETGELYTCQHYKKDGLYKPEKDLYAPTKSQVFRWYREKYGVISYIKPECLDVVSYYDYVIVGYDIIKGDYEEAENACIDKLIELSKQQDK